MTAYDHPARPDLRSVEQFRRKAAVARIAIAALERLDMPGRDCPAWTDLSEAHDLIEWLMDRMPTGGRTVAPFQEQARCEDMSEKKGRPGVVGATQMAAEHNDDGQLKMNAPTITRRRVPGGDEFGGRP